MDCAKYQLHQFFLENYAKATSPLSTIQPVFTDISGSLQRVNFTAQYKKHPLSLRDELEEFYTLPPEYFDPCDPIQWWSGHCSQFLNMSHLAQIVLAIPGEFTLTPLNVSTEYLVILLKGSAVVVKCIFSDGHDTISLHHVRTCCQGFSGFIKVWMSASTHVLHLPTNSVGVFRGGVKPLELDKF